MAGQDFSKNTVSKRLTKVHKERMEDKRPVKIFAPAKINLYLHITGRKENGYHDLDSLIVFADIGDDIVIESAGTFAFDIDGPFAQFFSPSDCASGPDSTNLAVRAAHAMLQETQNRADFKITLNKKLPLASGLGGGSADAASVIWGLCQWWGISTRSPWLHSLMLGLGAELPVCLSCVPTRIRGIGDILDPVPPLPEMPILLVNPGQACPTPQIFPLFDQKFRQPETYPDRLADPDRFLAFLLNTENSLTAAATNLVPAISEIVKLISIQKGCLLSRMSGAGASCYGLFQSEEDMQSAAERIRSTHPEWWIGCGWIGRPQRY